ncbi:MAG: hypothetical protein IIC04_03620 [Proteobacteria bacterium]|nr:hypothetical protein [Pseudomonadota bacterium]
MTALEADGDHEVLFLRFHHVGQHEPHARGIRGDRLLSKITNFLDTRYHYFGAGHGLSGTAFHNRALDSRLGWQSQFDSRLAWCIL